MPNRYQPDTVMPLQPCSRSASRVMTWNVCSRRCGASRRWFSGESLSPLVLPAPPRCPFTVHHDPDDRPSAVRRPTATDELAVAPGGAPDLAQCLGAGPDQLDGPGQRGWSPEVDRPSWGLDVGGGLAGGWEHDLGAHEGEKHPGCQRCRTSASHGRSCSICSMTTSGRSTWMLWLVFSTGTSIASVDSDIQCCCP